MPTNCALNRPPSSQSTQGIDALELSRIRMIAFALTTSWAMVVNAPAATLLLLNVDGEQHLLDENDSYRIEETRLHSWYRYDPFFPDYRLSNGSVEFSVYGSSDKQPLWRVSMEARGGHRGPILIATADTGRTQSNSQNEPENTGSFHNDELPIALPKLILPRFTKLDVGVYENAQSWCSILAYCPPQLKVEQNQSGKLVSVFGEDVWMGSDPIAAQPVPGRFEVLESEYDLFGNVTSFAADFEQYDPASDAMIDGKIRFNSSVPIPEPNTMALAGLAVIAHCGLWCRLRIVAWRMP